MPSAYSPIFVRCRTEKTLLWTSRFFWDYVRAHNPIFIADKNQTRFIIGVIAQWPKQTWFHCWTMALWCFIWLDLTYTIWFLWQSDKRYYLYKTKSSQTGGGLFGVPPPHVRHIKKWINVIVKHILTPWKVSWGAASRYSMIFSCHVNKIGTHKITRGGAHQNSTNSSMFDYYLL